MNHLLTILLFLCSLPILSKPYDYEKHIGFALGSSRYEAIEAMEMAGCKEFVEDSLYRRIYFDCSTTFEFAYCEFTTIQFSRDSVQYVTKTLQEADKPALIQTFMQSANSFTIADKDYYFLFDNCIVSILARGMIMVSKAE